MAEITNAEITDSNAKERARLRRSAFNLLARREQSRSELKTKLLNKDANETLVEDLLDNLVAEGLQSDERFVESFVNARVQRQQGPVKIGHELRQKGVADRLIDAALESFDDHWFEIAKELVVKKYGQSEPLDFNDKQRRMRFVMQRGFPADICYRLFD